MRREHKQLVTECAICGEPIYTSGSNNQALEKERRHVTAQLANHMLAHSSTERMRLALRAVLPAMTQELRLTALRRFYRAVLPSMSEHQFTATYGIDEALGSIELYRLWLESGHCNKGRCDEGQRDLARWRAQAARSREDYTQPPAPPI